jgi:hypothetical protein
MPYSNAPLNAWAGWRLRNPGGPVGGQYHGYIASDEIQDFMGWPAGPREMFRPMDNPAGLGIYPWQHWDKKNWAGSPLMEGQTVSDFVYRSPGEVRPRPNASGGVNTVVAHQLMRTAGYAVAPGNYRALGAAPTVATPGAYPWQGGPIRACPAWGCGATGLQLPISNMGPVEPPMSPVAPIYTVNQPPPPGQPAPAPVVGYGVGSSGCAPGQYRDAAGNCTTDWRNPYPLYLPLDNQIAPSPTVQANTCPTGYAVDGNGNCVPPGTECPAGVLPDANGNCTVSASSTGFMGWLQSSTSLFGLNVPNAIVGAGAVLVLMKVFRHK